ncbi:MAG: AraC family transcriptional regulator [Oscillospiraceae bacterium]|nr:AraC family transcriptional regulator [Oscillospiraceae bacterium]
MILRNVGYNHCHNADFKIERPEGSGDNLLLILKSESIITLNGNDILLPRNTFFLYPVGMPQYYRCVPGKTFENDWIHFLFEHEEAAWFSEKQIPLATPIPLRHTEFFSYCIKSIAEESYSDSLHAADSISHYFWLLCNKVSEQQHEIQFRLTSSKQEMMQIIRNKIQREPYLEWSVDWASHETNMSRSAFQHQYRVQFGVTFIQDLIASRIAYAKMLLHTTNMTVQDVALQCGYHNYEHFARQFKANCGTSPGAFRNNR